VKSIPDFSIENECGAGVVAGCDEAGRGPLCGPVVAAAVICPSAGEGVARSAGVVVTDSKQMTAKQRAAAYDWIMENCIVGIGQCSASEIDKINILQASMLAMKRALENLPSKPDFVLIDGNRLPDNINECSKCKVQSSIKDKNNNNKDAGKANPNIELCTLNFEHYYGKAIVKGDSKSLSIAAASVIAKETRDKIMRGLAQKFPQYGWDKNAGYPTESHLRAIKEFGINEHYRKTYKPIRDLLCGQ
jgi:ribonuclease HII